MQVSENTIVRLCLALFLFLLVPTFQISYYSFTFVPVFNFSSCFTLVISMHEVYIPSGIHTSCTGTPFPSVQDGLLYLSLNSMVCSWLGIFKLLAILLYIYPGKFTIHKCSLFDLLRYLSLG